jgi:acetoin utilization protein AcuB
MTKQPLLIKEVMHRSPHTIGADQTTEHAKKEMAKLGVRHLPILEGGKCIGIVSDRDIKLAYAVDGIRVSKLPITEISAGEVYDVSPETPVSEVAKQMVKRSIGSAIIMEHGKVVGIFTTTDACRVIAERLE